MKTPDAGTRRYGKRFVEVIKKSESPNLTLNLLVSFNGVESFNIIDTIQSWNFFAEACKATNMQSGRPAPEVEDIHSDDRTTSRFTILTGVKY